MKLTKTYHIEVPIELHEELLRVLPNHGEKSKYLREVLWLLVLEDSACMEILNNIREQRSI